MSELADLTAVILAGGFGTRLRPVVADRPKVLGKVRGRPFLAYLLLQLAAVGMDHVVLCIGYLGDQVKSEFGEAYGPLRLVYSQEEVPLGTAGALRLAMPLLRSDSVLVMNGDSFCDANLKDLWACHCAKNAEATLVLVEVSDTKRFGRVNVDADGVVLSFEEKDETSGQGWINAGIYLLNRSLLLTIPAGGAVSLEREVFPAWVGQAIYGYRSNGRFLDIGTPESYALADDFLAQNILK